MAGKSGKPEKHAAAEPGSAAALRLDKWLWQARFLKTRSLAAKHVAEAGVRINGQRTVKPAANVKVGDVLVFALGPHARQIRVAALGTRRGPAEEAQGLYEDLAPPPPRAPKDPAEARGPTRDPGAGRPTGRDRRALDRLREDG